MSGSATRFKRSTGLLIAAVAWVLLALGGSSLLLAVNARPSARQPPPRQWPDDTRLPRARGEATLLMFVHPNCPCTRASVAELLRTVSSLPGTSRPRVVFVVRRDEEKDWRSGWLLASAAAIPSSRLFSDDDLDEAHRFRAASSGLVLLYDAGGELIFDGGVTAGRGHEGRNAAADVLRSALMSSSASSGPTPVFGCELKNRQRPARS